MLAVRLETGVKQPEAIELYRRNGYVEIDPFGDYREDPLGVFMEKRFVESSLEDDPLDVGDRPRTGS